MSTHNWEQIKEVTKGNEDGHLRNPDYMCDVYRCSKCQGELNVPFNSDFKKFEEAAHANWRHKHVGGPPCPSLHDVRTRVGNVNPSCTTN